MFLCRAKKSNALVGNLITWLFCIGIVCSFLEIPCAFLLNLLVPSASIFLENYLDRSDGILVRVVR